MQHTTSLEELLRLIDEMPADVLETLPEFPLGTRGIEMLYLMSLEQETKGKENYPQSEQTR